MPRLPHRILLTALFLMLAFPGPTRLLAQDVNIDRKDVLDMLKDASEDVRNHFYDPNLKGLEWAALVDETKRRIEHDTSRYQMEAEVFALLDRLQDSHTFFLPPGRLDKALFGFEAEAFGDEVRISKLKDKAPAAKAGMQLGDRLITLNGFRVARNNYLAMKVFYRYIRPATALDITYAHGPDPPKSIHLQGEIHHEPRVADYSGPLGPTRFWREFELEHAHAENVRSEDYGNGASYLRLPSFTVDQEFLDHNVAKVREAAALIIDLRSNLGGSVQQLSRLMGYFEAQPVVIAETIGRKKTQRWQVDPVHPTAGMPLFILVDSETASAAEIFARHFQRSGRAIIIGDRTSGRVNEGEFFEHQIGLDRIIFYSIEIAVAQVVMEGGEVLEERGVTPDFPCTPSPDDLRDARDPCLDMARKLALHVAEKSLHRLPAS